MIEIKEGDLVVAHLAVTWTDDPDRSPIILGHIAKWTPPTCEITHHAYIRRDQARWHRGWTIGGVAVSRVRKATEADQLMVAILE